jgi:hypothetical protein
MNVSSRFITANKAVVFEELICFFMGSSLARARAGGV